MAVKLVPKKRVPEPIVEAPPTPRPRDEAMKKTREEDDNTKYKTFKQLIKEKNKLAEKERSQWQELKTKLEDIEKKVLPEDEVNRLRDMEKIVMLKEVESLPKWKEYDTAISKIA